MSISRSSLIPLAAAALVASFASAFAQQGVKIGTLHCDISGAMGVIVTQQKQLNCAFVDLNGRMSDHYIGRVTDVGVAVGGTTGGRLVWAVFAPSAGPSRGALAGTYVGATANAAAIIGGGANVLLGGSDRTFALQPISVQGQIGLNVTAGLSSMQLASAR